MQVSVEEAHGGAVLPLPVGIIFLGQFAETVGGDIESFHDESFEL